MVSGAVCYTLLASFNLQPAGLHLSCLRCCSACWRFISVTSSAKAPGGVIITLLKRIAMPWIQLKLNTTGSRAEDLSDALVESGAVSVTFQTPTTTRCSNPCRVKPCCGAIPT